MEGRGGRVVLQQFDLVYTLIKEIFRVFDDFDTDKRILQSHQPIKHSLMLGPSISSAAVRTTNTAATQQTWQQPNKHGSYSLSAAGYLSATSQPQVIHKSRF